MPLYRCYKENVFLWSRCDVNNGWHCEVEQMNCHQLCWLLEWKRAFLLFAFTQDTKPVSEMQKKNMHAILKTTSHNAAKVRAQEDRKPAIILDYDINKAGRDNLDKVTGTYSSNRTASGLSWYATISLPYQPPLTYKGFVVQSAETYLKGTEEELVEVIFGGAWKGPRDSSHVQIDNTSTAASAAALVRLVQRPEDGPHQEFSQGGRKEKNATAALQRRIPDLASSL